MSSSERYFRNDDSDLKSVDAHKELLSSLERINTLNPPVQTCSTGWHFYGLYMGPTSIAYLFYRLHTVYPDLEFKGQTMLDWAQAYLDLSVYEPKPDPDSNNCGITSETLAYYAVKAMMLKDASLVHKLCSYESAINSRGEPGSNEWVYGRAGYLYFLRLARSVFGADKSPSTFELLAQTISKTIHRILEEPQPWLWLGKHYIGAAHGTVGTICAVILSDPTFAPRLEKLLSDVLDQQYTSGNFPSLGQPGSDVRVQFCHGGPGFIFSLNSILPYFPSLAPQIKEAMNKARHDIWKRGLLTKEPSLCHGIAGNGLALETTEQIQHFLAHMTSEAMEEKDWMSGAGKTDEFVGLLTGEAGRAWAWAVLDQNLPRTCIGYNDL